MTCTMHGYNTVMVIFLSHFVWTPTVILLVILKFRTKTFRIEKPQSEIENSWCPRISDIHGHHLKLPTFLLWLISWASHWFNWIGFLLSSILLDKIKWFRLVLSHQNKSTNKTELASYNNKNYLLKKNRSGFSLKHKASLEGLRTMIHLYFKIQQNTPSRSLQGNGKRSKFEQRISEKMGIWGPPPMRSLSLEFVRRKV